MLAPTLDTERLILRAIVESDLEDCFAYSKEPNVGMNAGWKPHESLEETKEIMRTIFMNQPSVWGMVLRETCRIFGSLGLIPDPKYPEPRTLLLGYAMSETLWGRGLMTEAVRAVLDYGFSVLELERITATCYSFNSRSRRVLEKTGFLLEAHLDGGETRYDGVVCEVDRFVQWNPLRKEKISGIAGREPQQGFVRTGHSRPQDSTTTSIKNR